MFFFTSDPHGEFERILDFANENLLTSSDTIVVLGDSCFNYYFDQRDERLKREVSENLPCLLLNVRGNHDARPERIPGYVEENMFGGTVMFEPTFPNLVFTRDGEGYEFDGVSSFVIGGAITIMPEKHIAEGLPVFNHEVLDEDEKAIIEHLLETSGWQTDLMLTHSAPQRFVRPEMLFSEYDQEKIDHSYEYWLDSIEERLSYRKWLFGHFHHDLDVSDKVSCLNMRILSLEDVM